jgi:RNA polymerase sigma-70 factor, ECF subfamily
MTRDDVTAAYRQYGYLVARRCRRLMRDDGEAEDALQEAFLRLWRYGDAWLRAESKLLWLYRVADRCCFDLMASRGRRARVALDRAESPSEARPDPTRAIEDGEVMIRFLDRFDDRVKRIVVLRYVDELGLDEIAAETGWSRQTIGKKLVHLQKRASGLRALLCGEGA